MEDTSYFMWTRLILKVLKNSNIILYFLYLNKNVV